jgi:hypothetical protein
MNVWNLLVHVIEMQIVKTHLDHLVVPVIVVILETGYFVQVRIESVLFYFVN